MLCAKCPNFITRHDFNHLPHDRTTMPKLKANFPARFHVFKLPWGGVAACWELMSLNNSPQLERTERQGSLAASVHRQCSSHGTLLKRDSQMRQVFLLVMPVSYTKTNHLWLSSASVERSDLIWSNHFCVFFRCECDVISYSNWEK